MATYTYWVYPTNNQYVINGSPVQVTFDDTDGLIALNNTVTVGTTNYTVKGFYPNGNPLAGDFTADTGGSGRWFFSSNGSLTNGFDADGQTGFTTAGTTSLTCFLAGTLIMTEAGEVPVEALSIGDKVMTADGEAVPVRWIGRQTVLRLFAPREQTYPICIAAGALAENVPSRDLCVSPDHAMLVDGLLVNASALVNGSTIRQVTEMPERFTYYHIETAEHCAVLAEGAPAETFVDNVPRQRFDNWSEYEALYPGWQPIAEMALPRVPATRLLPQRVRARLAERARMLGFGGRSAAA